MSSNNAVIKTWFAQPILEVFDLISEDENENLIKQIEFIKSNTQSGGKGWNTNVYNTYEKFSLHTSDFFNNLITKIEYNTDKFALQLGSEAEYKVNESWFNFYNKYDYQEYHYHPFSFFSAIYFFKNPENAGKTIFKSYEEPNMLPLKNLIRNKLSQSNCDYSPSARTLLIFKSNLLHMVSQSQSDEPRITASFNLV